MDFQAKCGFRRLRNRCGEGTDALRAFYAQIVRDYDETELWQDSSVRKYPAMTVQIVFSPQETGKRGAMYFPDNRVIEIYRAGLAESSVEQAAGIAALADDPMTELLLFAHELGHHKAVLLSLGTGSSTRTTRMPPMRKRFGLGASLIRSLIEAVHGWRHLITRQNKNSQAIERAFACRARLR